MEQKRVQDHSNEGITEKIFDYISQSIKLQSTYLITELYLNNNQISSL